MPSEANEASPLKGESADGVSVSLDLPIPERMRQKSMHIEGELRAAAEQRSAKLLEMLGPFLKELGPRAAARVKAIVDLAKRYAILAIVLGVGLPLVIPPIL